MHIKTYVNLKAFTLVSLILLTGCSNEDYTIKYKKSNKLNVNSSSSCLIIDKIGDVKIKEDMIKNNEIIIKDYSVTCTPVNTTKEGIYNVKFNTNQAENNFYEKEIIITDLEKPVIRFKKPIENGVYKVKLNDFNTDNMFNKMIVVSDNFDTNPKISLKGNITKTPGEHILTITATDKNKNSTSKKLKIVLLEDKITNKPNEPAKPSEPTIPIPTPTVPNNPKPSNPSTQTPNKPAATPTKISKDFLFKSNDDAIDVFNACLVEMYSIQNASCIPIYNTADEAIGYRLIGVKN